MNKEPLFFSCLSIMIIFQIGYYLMDIQTRIFTLTVGIITSAMITVLVIGIVAGVNGLSFGLADKSVGFAAIMAMIASLFIRIDIPLSYFGIVGDGIKFVFGLDSIPIGIGMLYPNMTSIFITSDNNILSIFGLIIITVVTLITVVTGLMIADGV
jgi:hypothetical protein